MTSHYETLTGRQLDLTGLTAEQRSILDEVVARYREEPDWTKFSSAWQEALARALPGFSSEERVEHVLYKVFQDLEIRLGIRQGKVAPPDYRDYLVDRIEEKYGSRYQFCQETGVSQAFLSQVLSGKKNFSIEKLREVADALDLALALLPLPDLVSVPTTDTAAVKRVSRMVTEELTVLTSARAHLERFEDPARRYRALEKERALFGSPLDSIRETLQGEADVEARGERVLDLLDEEIAKLEGMQNDLRKRIARAREPDRTGEEDHAETLSRM